MWVDRGGFDTAAQEPDEGEDRPDEINLYRSSNHIGNFLDCVISRRLTITPAEVAHRSASVGHLCVIAIALGRKMRWNPDNEEILGDPAADACWAGPSANRGVSGVR